MARSRRDLEQAAGRGGMCGGAKYVDIDIPDAGAAIGSDPIKLFYACGGAAE